MVKLLLDRETALAIHYLPLPLAAKKRLTILASSLSDLEALLKERFASVLDDGEPLPVRGRWSREHWLSAVEQSQKWLDKTPDASFATVYNEEFPPLLTEIPDAPFLLFYRGTLPEPSRPLVAIVGSRACTGESREQAYDLGFQLAQAGLSVTSGLARGIDISAEKGCFEGGGAPVSFIGCGLAHIYPKSNEAEAERFLSHGGSILTELSPLALPRPYQFPRRNRLISGISRAVIVVEAAQRSGSLITARNAIEQGREIFITESGLRRPGPNGLADLEKEGVIALSDIRPVLSALGWNSPPAAKTSEPSLPSGSEATPKAVGEQLARELERELLHGKK